MLEPAPVLVPFEPAPLLELVLELLDPVLDGPCSSRSTPLDPVLEPLDPLDPEMAPLELPLDDPDPGNQHAA